MSHTLRKIFLNVPLMNCVCVMFYVFYRIAAAKQSIADDFKVDRYLLGCIIINS